MQRITHDGRTMTIAEWSRASGIQYGKLWRNLKKGIPLEVALRPDRHKRRQNAAFLKTLAIDPEIHQRIREMAARRGVFLTELAGQAMIAGLEELKRREREQKFLRRKDRPQEAHDAN